jgi:hypothetical protein
MNIKITKLKNISSANTLTNRLARLEKILQQLLQSSEDATKKTSDFSAGGQQNSFADLLTSSFGSGKIKSINQSTAPTIRAGNIAKTGRSNLLLSQGQIVAELAAAVARASRRNS